MDRRRRDLRLKWDEVAARAGIHRETLRQIRIGNGDIRPLSATGIEDALEWEHGSIDTVLDGGEPTPLGGRPAPEPTVAEPTIAQLADQLAEEKRLRTDLEQRFEDYLRQQDTERQRRRPSG